MASKAKRRRIENPEERAAEALVMLLPNAASQIQNDLFVQGPEDWTNHGIVGGPFGNPNQEVPTFPLLSSPPCYILTTSVENKIRNFRSPQII